MGRKRYNIEYSVPIAKNVFWAIDSTWKQRTHLGIYHGQILPQDKYIPADLAEKEASLFFFYAVLGQRRSVPSEKSMRVWWRFKEEMPEAFNPKVVIKKLSPQIILSGLQNAAVAEGASRTNAGGLGLNLKKISEYWYKNSFVLMEHL